MTNLFKTICLVCDKEITDQRYYIRFEKKGKLLWKSASPTHDGVFMCPKCFKERIQDYNCMRIMGKG